ncbi:hypothetical protein ACH4D4_05085 [Streptomyces pristinaespiralis]|uniref:hypothetical protein n=1 Tax=Streptomyces pristinaespiralis TaxID=38300 RepID=UPI00379B4C9B
MSDSDNVIPLFRDNPHAQKWQEMIELWEAMYLSHGETLTKPQNAASLRVAMHVMQALLEAAEANDVISASQLEELAAFLKTGHAAADYWTS